MDIPNKSSGEHWQPVELGVRRRVVSRLARPLVRLCVRCSLSIQDLGELLKDLFVQEANEELSQQSIKPNVSRLSAITGLRRPEVKRILAGSESIEGAPLKGLLARVMGQWRYDPEFCSHPGSPRRLTCRGPDPEFRRLCLKVSSTLNPGTVQFEFLRRGFAKRDGVHLELLYKVEPLERDPIESFELASKDVEALLESVQENVLNPQPLTNLHIHTEFDNITPQHLSTIRQWLMVEGKAFHARARNFLSQFDRDLNPELQDDKTDPGARVVLTAFSVTHPAPDEHNSGV